MWDTQSNAVQCACFTVADLEVADIKKHVGHASLTLLPK